MKDKTVAVVGLGYVGLPLVVEFGKHMKTIGFDTNPGVVRKCQAGTDPSDELTDAQMAEAIHAVYTVNPTALQRADYIIVAVPTPVDNHNVPDFGPLINASRTVGMQMKPGVLVIYESTVYPGATEEVCILELSQASGMDWKKDFNVGYSPERINPGDPEHSLTKVVKVVSGDTPATLDIVDDLYKLIVTAGTYRASSIKVAEAAKVIENTQRDLNIALMNELALIFNRMGLDTLEVLKAAGSKWNFLPFRPGLVGGHCIGVDPYYLTYKAEQVGYHPEVILAGRRVNDSMGKFVAEQTIKGLIQHNIPVEGALVTILGLAFKENCSDLRNSKVVDIFNELREYGVGIQINDVLVPEGYAMHHYGIALTPFDQLKRHADAVILAVPHCNYIDLVDDSLYMLEFLLKPGGVLMDVKSRVDIESVTSKGFHLWRL